LASAQFRFDTPQLAAGSFIKNGYPLWVPNINNLFVELRDFTQIGVPA